MPLFMTTDLKKFLSSEYGYKTLKTAKSYGQNFFNFGKKRYKLDQLVSLSETLKNTCELQQKE